MEKIKIRPHKWMIIQTLYPLLSLLILPLIQGLLTYGTKYYTWPKVLFAEILLILSSIVFAVLKTRKYYCEFSKQKVYIKKGLIFRTSFEINTQQIGVISLKYNAFMMAFAACNLKIYTESEVKSKAVVSIPIKISDAKIIRATFNCKEDKQFVGSFFELLIMSTVTSSAAVGLLISAPVVNKIGSLLQVSLSHTIYDGILRASARLPHIIPNVARIATIIFVIGYLISFFYIFLKYFGMKIFVKKDMVVLKSGVFPRRITILNSEKITALSIVQTPLMALLKRVNVNMSIGGYGEGKSKESILFPAVCYTKAEKNIAKICPCLKKRKLGLKAPKRAFWKFFSSPILLFAVIVISAVVLSKFFVLFSDLIWFITIIFLLLVMVVIIMRIKIFNISGITFADTVCMLSARKTSILEVRTKRENISFYRLTQNIYDKSLKLCRLKVGVNNKNRNKVSIISLDYNKTKNELFNLYDLIS